MAILVTRPHPDNEATAAALRGMGHEVLLAPMLRFEAVASGGDLDAGYHAVIVTSANALRAIDLAGHAVLAVPLFAVGEHTAEAARAAGFAKVISAKGDSDALRDLLRARVKAKELKRKARLLYLAGADLSRDFDSFVRRKPANATNDRSKVFAVDVLHRQKGNPIDIAYIKNAANVGM